jgi:hypothetical protein
MKGYNGNVQISNATRLKMSLASKRTCNGFKKGHKGFISRHSEATKQKLRVIAKKQNRRPIQPKGYKHSQETIEKMRQAKLLRPVRYWKGKDRSEIFTPEYKLNMSKIIKKLVDNGTHNFWKGGLTKLSKIARSSSQYKQWRKAVFERDNYTCKLCGIRGGKLEADHIKPFSLFIKLRYKISNGRTLCKQCHLGTDTYGRKALKLAFKIK